MNMCLSSVCQPSDRVRKVQAAQRTMAHIGNELLSDAKAAAQAIATEKGEIEKNSLHGRDLLSLLVKANMATDIPESQRLSDEDVLARAFSLIRGLVSSLMRFSRGCHVLGGRS
jgi:hypothetical protein